MLFSLQEEEWKPEEEVEKKKTKQKACNDGNPSKTVNEAFIQVGSIQICFITLWSISFDTTHTHTPEHRCLTWITHTDQFSILSHRRIGYSRIYYPAYAHRNDEDKFNWIILFERILWKRAAAMLQIYFCLTRFLLSFPPILWTKLFSGPFMKFQTYFRRRRQRRRQRRRNELDCSFFTVKCHLNVAENMMIYVHSIAKFSFIFRITMIFSDGIQNISLNIIVILSHYYYTHNSIEDFGHLFWKYFHISMKLNRIGSRVLEFIQSKQKSYIICMWFIHMYDNNNNDNHIDSNRCMYNLLLSTAKFQNANNEHFSEHNIYIISIKFIAIYLQSKNEEIDFRPT